MRNWKVLALATVVSTSVALLAGCGSSSDSTSNGATKSARAAAPLAATALDTGTLVSQLQKRITLPRTVAATPATSGSTAGQGLNAAVARFQNSGNVSAMSARETTTQGFMASTCTTGKVTMTGNTRVYENCEYTQGNKMFFEDGTITLSSVGSGDSSTFTFDAGTAQKPYVYRESMMMTGAMAMLVFEVSVTATVTGTNSGKMCNGGSNVGYSNSTMNMTGEFRIKEYLASGVASTDRTLKAANLSEVVAVKSDPNNCMPTDITVTENGSIELADHLNSADSMSMKATNLVMHSVESTNTAMQQILTMSLTGTMDVTSSCFSSSLTFATVENIVYMLDDGEIDSCPIAGKLAISGSVVSTIKFTATGGVEIDLGSDGTVDQTFKRCEEAGLCS